MIVETETAIYLLDVPGLKLWRFPRDEALELEEYKDMLPAAVAELRMDGEAIPYDLLAPLEVGKPAQFQLHIRKDVVTIRTTTHVVRIIE